MGGAFRAVGYLHNSVPDEAALPRGPLRLHRATGGADLDRLGLSWSSTLEGARFFADYNMRWGLAGEVVTMLVQQDELLGRFTTDAGDAFRGEDEYLVHLDG